MNRHIFIVLFIFASLSALIGCGGGGGSERQIGTTDQRILGSWRAREIRYAGETATCPGSITSGDDTVSCNSDRITFQQNGTSVTGGTSEQYYFDGTTLTGYGQTTTRFNVSFTNNNDAMTWTYSEDGRTATIVLDRVVLN